MYYEFVINGEPMGKQRPRVLKTGRAYTPKETVSYENLVKLTFQQYYPYSEPTDEELEVTITAYFSIPSSWSRKRKEEALDGKISPTKKPDCDNIAKIILDSLNGIAYLDDKQVTELVVIKKYAEFPKVVVKIADI